MGRYEYEFTHQMAGVEKQLENIENPLHRTILKNFRLHGLLEVSGRYRELLAPHMTVEEPVYRLHEAGGTLVLDGMAQVTAFYESLLAADALVMWIGETNLAVSDWGFSGEVVFHQFLPGGMLADSVFSKLQAGDTTAGSDIDDPAATYLLRRTMAFAWPYDQNGRLIGEHVYEDPGSKEIIKPDPADVITAARAVELLAPELEKQLP